MKNLMKNLLSKIRLISTNFGYSASLQWHMHDKKRKTCAIQFFINFLPSSSSVGIPSNHNQKQRHTVHVSTACSYAGSITISMVIREQMIIDLLPFINNGLLYDITNDHTHLKVTTHVFCWVWTSINTQYVSHTLTLLCF